MQRLSPDKKVVPERRCKKWNDVLDWCGQFKVPSESVDQDGEIKSTEWVFRGQNCSSYRLQPTIEREATGKTLNWTELEVLVMSEFQARVAACLEPTKIPRSDLDWLSLAQHYGVPIRLLDFTYSPFVALYFAVRGHDPERHDKAVRIWVMSLRQVNQKFDGVAGRGRRAPDDKERLFRIESPGDAMFAHVYGRRTKANSLLGGLGYREGAKLRAKLVERGCVCGIGPNQFNTRLSSQQGLFFVNLAEPLDFSNSCEKMMSASKSNWIRCVDIESGIVREIEERLFQMNINEYSLFPDLQGVRGLIDQRLRLSWRAPNNE